MESRAEDPRPRLAAEAREFAREVVEWAATKTTLIGCECTALVDLAQSDRRTVERVALQRAADYFALWYRTRRGVTREDARLATLGGREPPVEATWHERPFESYLSLTGKDGDAVSELSVASGELADLLDLLRGAGTARGELRRGELAVWPSTLGGKATVSIARGPNAEELAVVAKADLPALVDAAERARELARAWCRKAGIETPRTPAGEATAD